MQAWSSQVYGDMSIEGLETMHYERLGDVGERLEALSVTKRFTSTGEPPRPVSFFALRPLTHLATVIARFMSQHRASGGSTPGLGRTSSTTSSSSGYTKPASTYGAASSSSAAAGDLPPPAYSAPSSGATPTLAGKRPPPPPPPSSRPKAAVQYVTALYDYVGQAEGDLSFNAGDRIEVVKKTESDQDWWTGRLNGYEGQFPANYTQS